MEGAFSMSTKSQIFTNRQEMRSHTFEIFRYKDAIPRDVALHHHDFYEIYFFLSGSVLYNIESHSYLLTPGDILLIQPMQLHQPIFDGKSGNYCGVSTICSASLTVVAILMSSSEAALLTAILAGSCLGFLPFNSHPAKIFMGDAGALFLGYTLSVLSVTGIFKTHAVLAFLIPMSVFGLPLFDTAFAVIRRLLHGQSPFHADRGHIHHRLIDMGFGHRRSVLTLYAICGILGIAAVMLTLPVLYPALIIIVCALALFLGTSFVMRHPETREQTALIDAEKASSAPVKTPEKSEKKEVVPQLEAKKKEV